MKRDRAEAAALGQDDVELDDSDYVNFRNALEQDIAEDEMLIKEESEEDE